MILGMARANQPLLKVEVGPLEPEKLSLPHPRMERGENYGLEPSRGIPEKPLLLRVVQPPKLVIMLRQMRDGSDRIAFDIAPPLRLGEDP